MALSAFIFSWQIKAISSPGFIKSVFNDAKIYEQITGLTDTLSNQSQSDFYFVALMKTFTRSIDQELAQKQLNNFIDNFYLYMNDKASLDKVELDLKAIKSDFVSKWPQIAPQVFYEEYLQLPICPNVDFNKEAFLASTQITCQTSALTEANFKDMVSKADIVEFTNSIPDKITLQELLKENNGAERIKDSLKIFSGMLIISFFVLIIALAGIIFFTWPDYRSILNKIGWSTFLASLPAILTSLLANNGLKNLQILASSAETSKITALLSPTITVLNNNLLLTIVRLPIIICAVGIFLLILSLFIPKTEEKIIPPGFEVKPG